MPSGKRRFPGLWARRRGTIRQTPRPRKHVWPRCTRQHATFACLVLTCFALWPAAGLARSYRVKKGEVLSEISRRFLHGDVWGTRGTLAAILALNRDIVDPHLIKAGQVIRLPRKDEACAAVLPPPQPCPPPVACPAPVACSPPNPIAPVTCDCNQSLSAPMTLVKTDAISDQPPSENPHGQRGPELRPNSAPATGDLWGNKARRLELRVSPYYRFSQLNAKVYADRSAASLDSRFNTGIIAGLSVELVHRLSLSVDLQAGTIYFASPKTAALSGGATFEYSAAITLQWAVVARLALLTGFTYGSEPFSTADATLVLDIQMVSMPGLMAGLSLTALQFSQHSFGVDIAADYKFTVHTPQFQVRNGNVLFAAVFWRYAQNDRTRWRARLGFGQRRQDTSLISQTDNTLALEASYVWPVD